MRVACRQQQSAPAPFQLQLPPLWRVRRAELSPATTSPVRHHSRKEAAMKCLRVVPTLLLFLALTTAHALAQAPPPISNCIDNLQDPYDPNPPCNQYLLTHLSSGQFQATPFVDTVPDGNGHWPDYGDPDHNVVSLYGIYGNNEKTSSSAAAQAHYAQGKTLAGQIQPLCPDGTTNCTDAQKAIVFLFIGFSNTDIEIGGGNSDVWDGTGDGQNTDPTNHFNMHLFGQPCSTKCETSTIRIRRTLGTKYSFLTPMDTPSNRSCTRYTTPRLISWGRTWLSLTVRLADKLSPNGTRLRLDIIRFTRTACTTTRRWRARSAITCG